jgi:hypothetical protein
MLNRSFIWDLLRNKPLGKVESWSSVTACQASLDYAQ